MFSEIVRRLRKEAGLTQVEVAEAVGITWRQYQRLEAGGGKPGFDSLLALADCFNVSLDYLVGRSAKREVAEPLPGPGQGGQETEK